MRQAAAFASIPTLAALLLVMSPALRPALAGPNAGGTLIVHGIPGIIPTPPEQFCGYGPLDDCVNANVQYEDGLTHIWKVYAAFPLAGNPRLKGVTFGIDYPADDITIREFGPCAEFELSDQTWPAPGTGNSLVWDETQTQGLVEAYWFMGYNYYSEAALFALTPNPDQGGWFADDSVPSILDGIAEYGALGFFMPGTLLCPDSGLGSCCLEWGECILTTEPDCLEQCGIYLGYGLPCDPNPCPIYPLDACCFPDGSCELRGAYYCECYGGEWQGPETDCEPNPCGPISTERENWGQIKARYRD